MECFLCGPHPETTIWDGVTVSFNSRHLQSSLEPPTSISPGKSPVRPNVIYVKGQQCLQDKSLRQSLRRIITGPSLLLPAKPQSTLSRGQLTDNPETLEADESDDNDEAIGSERSNQQKIGKDILARVELIPKVMESLTTVNVDLAQMFDYWFGISALSARREAPSAYHRFFTQVAADESILQMMNRPALATLSTFNRNPTHKQLSLLIHIPALYNILEIGFTRGSGQLLSWTIGVCKWLQDRASAVMERLLEKNMSAGAAGEARLPGVDGRTLVQKDWKLTGCYYAMPQVRARPEYPQLAYDQAKKDSATVGAKRGNCSKYYSRYSESRLTGGIMVKAGTTCFLRSIHAGRLPQSVLYTTSRARSAPTV
ncbi:hypothetical protein MD484_g4588, partial [Candolleomyces efflorescens]